MHSIQQEQLHDLLVLGGAVTVLIVVLVTSYIFSRKAEKNQQ